MVNLFLVRHAESIWNVESRYQGILDPDLSEKGHTQAKITGNYFNSFFSKKLYKKPSFVYSSPLTRTRKTALEIAKALDIPLIQDRRLIEIDHGDWSGKLLCDIEKKYKEDFKTWLEKPDEIYFPNGESLKEVRERVKDFINFLLDNHYNESIVAVSHSVPIRVFYIEVLNIELSKFWKFGCDNASFSVLSLDKKQSVIRGLNYTYHLGEYYVEAHRAI